MSDCTILVCCPNYYDSTSFYRAMGAFHALRKKNRGLRLAMVERVDWSIMGSTDLMFLQRPFTEGHFKLCTLAKNMRVPIWIDYDDNLFKVPSDNPSYGTYHDDAVKKRMAEMIAMADVVTVSTEFLKEELGSLNKKIHVVENAINDSLFTLTEDHPKRNPMLLWRGSETHVRDLWMYGREVVDFSAKSKKTSFHFAGYNPWFITDSLPESQCTISDPLPIFEYMKFIKTVKPKAFFVPLADHAFNRSKSNIAWLEATMAGALTLAPKWDEWEQPGVVTYENQEQFSKGLDHISTVSDADHAALLLQSMSLIKKKYLLSIQNGKREAILNKLCNA